MEKLGWGGSDKAGGFTMVYLVGAGPGDKDYITVKGLRLIEKCDVIIYDRLANMELLTYTKASCEKIYVGKQNGYHTMNQEAINKILVEQGKENKLTVRLKGGDPFVFGRGGEEILALEDQGIPYEVVSGVTSAISVPASAGIPLTHRKLSQSIHIITGHTATSKNQLTQDYEHLAKVEGTLVFLMGLSNIEKITEQLIKYGKNPCTPAAVVSKGTTNAQISVRASLEKIGQIVREKNLQAPAIIIVGEVAALNFTCTRLEEKRKLRVGVTGTQSFVNRCTAMLQENNITSLDMGFMVVKETGQETWQQVFETLPLSTWLAFTNANGVRLFFGECERRRFDRRELAHVKLAVIGSGTREALESNGIYPDYCPNVYTAEELAKGLCGQLSSEDRVLMPRAVKGSKMVNEIFAGEQKVLYDIPTYDVVYDREKWERKREEMRGLDCLVFGSTSGVEGFFQMAGEKEIQQLSNMRIIAIGPVTREALLKRGVEHVEIGEQCCIESLVKLIVR